MPGTGLVQLYRIVDALLDTQIVLSYYWKEIDVIPRRMLPPNALVIALSPLLDPRSVGALLDLRARGYDLAVIDVSPVPFTSRPAGGLDAVALRPLDAATRRASSSPAQHGRRRRRVERARDRCRPFSRRCGNSGATPGTRASDHRARARWSRSEAYVVYATATAGRFAPVAIVRARSAVGLLALGIVLRWPTLVPWTICWHGAGYVDRPRGEGPRRRLVGRVGVLLLLAAELASWSIEHDARIRTEDVARAAPDRDAGARSAAPRCS